VLKSDASWVSVADDGVYRVGTIEYVAAGKDGFGATSGRLALPNSGNLKSTCVLVDQGFIEFAKAQKVLVALPYDTVTFLAP